jgi:hypothetical protein
MHKVFCEDIAWSRAWNAVGLNNEINPMDWLHLTPEILKQLGENPSVQQLNVEST